MTDIEFVAPSTPQEISLWEDIAAIEGLSDPDRFVLWELARWRHIMARPEQLFPQDAQFAFLLGGRGSGKTQTGSRTIFEWAWELPGTEWGLVGPTRNIVRGVMFVGPSGLRNVIPNQALWSGDWSGSFNETRLELRLSNGSVITGYASERPGRIRGANLSGFWGDEPAEWKDSGQLPMEIGTTFSNLLLATRADTEGGTRGIITGTPTPCPLLAGSPVHNVPGLLTGLEEPKITIVPMSTRANLQNLDATFRSLVMSLEGTRLGRQEIDGELLTDVEGAAFQAFWIVTDNEALTTNFDRVCVAVDPSGGDGSEDNDEVGVVVVASSGRMYFVLEDLSGSMGPGEWSRTVWEAYDRWKPQSYTEPHIKVEGNYGKELAVLPLKVSEFKRPGVQIDNENVRGSKFVRASATAQLYEPSLDSPVGQRVVHGGRFPALVNEMTTFTEKSNWSPNRLDALTLGMNWLAQFDKTVPSPPPGVRRLATSSLRGRHSGGYR